MSIACPCGCGGTADIISSDGSVWRCHSGREHSGSFRNAAYEEARTAAPYRTASSASQASARKVYSPKEQLEELTRLTERIVSVLEELAAAPARLARGKDGGS